jgi:hypothetical protein
MSARYVKWGAFGAIAYPILQLISQGLIQFGGSEPAFTAPAQEILGFFQSKDSTFIAISELFIVLSIIAFLWFLGALWRELRLAEGEAGWISIVAVGSGLVAAAGLLIVGGWGLAFFRVEEGLDPQIARLLFDEGNLSFANLWVSLGSMLLAAGVIFRESGENQGASYPKWLGGGSIILGIGLILARAIWTSQIAFLPYVLFWAWMIAFGVYVLRNQTRGDQK